MTSKGHTTAPSGANPDVLETLRTQLCHACGSVKRAIDTKKADAIHEAKTRLKHAVNDAYSHGAIRENMAVELYAQYELGEF